MKKQANRREFLGSSVAAFAGAAAATVASPTVITSCALGAGRPAPSNRITLGFIGVGWKGLRGCFGSLLQNFSANPVSQPLAVCDVNAQHRADAKVFVDRRYGKSACAAYNGFRDVLSRDDVDAVVIATPDHWHAALTIRACQQGKDVYCEKPLSLTVREARAMVEAARQYGRVVQTGNQSRSKESLQFACGAVRSGKIGRLLEVHASCGGPSVPCNLPPRPVPEHIDWDLWLGPAPWRPFHETLANMGFRAYRDYSGGGMTDWGAHHFDLGQWAMGMDDSGPVEIVPPTGEQRWLCYKYANGTLMYHNSPPSRGGVCFVGTEGQLWCRGMSDRMESTPEDLCRRFRHAGEQEVYGSDTGKPHADNFLECVRTRERPNSDVEIGCRTATVCHLGNLAYWLGRPLKWDPEREEIVGDEEAGRMLSRATRPT